MNEIAEKLSTYNIFNYLFPGALFSAVIDYWTPYSMLQDSWIAGLVVYYFVGLIISTFGSLLISPALRGLKFVKYKDYGDYVRASKEDKVIETLSEQRGMYRTLFAGVILLLLAKLSQWLGSRYAMFELLEIPVFVTLVGGLLLFAYRKQNRFIIRRIEVAQTKKSPMKKI